MSRLAAIKAWRRGVREGRPCSAREGAECGKPASVQGKSAGFTLTEALATVIIVGLVTSILASGIALASRQYTQSMARSEAQMLCSSLQKILDTELRFTKTIDVSDPSAGISDVQGFVSKHYIAQKKDNNTGAMESTSQLCSVVEGADGKMKPQEPNTPGQLGMSSGYGASDVYNTFLGPGSYSYGLKACVTSFTYNNTDRYFTITLIVTQGDSSDDEALAKEVFTVKALNVTEVK